MQGKSIGYIEKLDHIRFLAAFAVLMFHVELLATPKAPSWVPLFHEGHVGVQLFMVVSGFILAMIAFERRVDIPKFYLNRVLRIYPLFVVVVSLGYFLNVDRPSSAGIDYLLALLPVSNLYRNHYGPFGGQFWSVAVELQFYLFFPFLVAAIDRYGDRFAWLLVLLMLVLRTLIHVQYGTVHHLAYFTIFGALDPFLVGILAGRWHVRSRGLVVGAWAPVAALVLANVLVYAFFRGNFFHVDFAGGRPASPSRLWIVWPTVGALMFAALILSYLKCSAQIPFSAVFAAFGKWSYSSYVWHWMIAVLVVQAVGAYGLHPYVTGAFIVFPLTMALAALSYYTIERPFLDFRVAYAKA